MRLVIFDNLGREVRTAIHEHKPDGRCQITLDMSGLSTGAYFYRLQTGADFSETRKMVYLR